MLKWFATVHFLFHLEMAWIFAGDSTTLDLNLDVKFNGFHNCIIASKSIIWISLIAFCYSYLPFLGGLFCMLLI